MFILLVTINILLIVLSITFGIYALIIKEYTLSISAFSVLSATISGLVATMVLKANKDKERPYILIRPNYKKYGFIQITVENVGTEVAVIDDVSYSKEIILFNKENFFEEIKGIALPPGDSVNFPLMNINQYNELSSNYTCQGVIIYRDINDKKYKDKFLFNIENQGASFVDNDPTIKTNYKLQQLPDELKKINKELKKLNK